MVVVMSAEHEISNSNKEILTGHIKRLDSLQQEEGNGSVHLLQEYYLQSIYNILSPANKYNANLSQLDTNILDELAKICIIIVDSHEFATISSSYSETISPEHWALRILIFITKRPFCTPHSHKTLKMIYEMLINQLRNFVQSNYPNVLESDMKLINLLVHCLSQDNFGQIILPFEAYKLIKDSVFPLAVWCFTRATANKHLTLQDFEDDFHGLVSFCKEQLKEYKYTYSHVVQLLRILMKRSEHSQFGGYKKKFESMLDLSLKTGTVNDELIVVLNSIAAYKIGSPGSGSFPFELFLDFMSKSGSPHRAHIAYMILKGTRDYHFHLTLCKLETKVALARAMIDNLAGYDDELLDQITLDYFSLVSEHYYTDLSDSKYLGKLVLGREIRIMKKLMAKSTEPKDYYNLLFHFNRIRDYDSSLEFDELAQILITHDIEGLHHFIKLWKRNDDQIERFKAHLKRLTNLLRLRRNPLKAGGGIKLQQLFDLLTDYEFSEYLKTDYGMLLVFANCFHMHQSAWSSIIKLIQFDAEARLSVHCAYDDTGVTETITATLSHFLLTDADYFYREFGSLTTIKLIYEHCERVIDSCCVSNLVKEILLTWPKEVDKTKLDSTEHDNMLRKFVLLLVNDLDCSFESAEAKTCASNIDRYVSALSGLIVAYKRHHEVLYDVLDYSKKENLKVRDSWLKVWTRLIIGSENQVDRMVHAVKKRANMNKSFDYLDGYFHLRAFADVVIAYEALTMINGGSPDFRKLSKSSRADLLKVVSSALDRSIEQAPINSLELKRYQQMKASLSPGQPTSNQ